MKSKKRKVNAQGYFILSVVWPPELVKELDDLAKREHRSFSAQVVHLVSASLEKTHA